MSRVPVVIAACKEEAYIGRTLAALDARSVEPLLVVNGSDDATARIGKEFGADVLELPEAGKLPALQKAIRSLGERALDPIIFLDADSRPLFPRMWAKAMTQSMTQQRPSANAGMISYTEGAFIDSAAWSIRSLQKGVSAKIHGAPRFSGANMAVRLYDRPTLQRFLDMPHIWWGEDRAIGRMISLQSGKTAQIINPRAVVLTSARYVLPVQQRIKLGHDDSTKAMKRDYLQRAPAGSRPFRPKSKLGY